jgi:cyclic pyranopterin phosphate synthase
MTDASFSHVNAAGEANMVDISDKLVTTRVAVAISVINMQAATLQAIQTDALKKGEVLAVARVAGIQAAKRCAELIPLCHPLPLNKVQIDFEVLSATQLQVRAECRVEGKTGVEMEALTAASVAALTVYDMCKAIDKTMVITDLHVAEKRGGKSGSWQAGVKVDTP